MRELLAYSQWAVIEEKLTLRIKADDNGDIYVPTAWYSPEGVQSCSYNWNIGVDDITPVNYSGTGTSSSKIRVGYWLVPLSIHTVIIRPVVEDYGWLRAFWYKGTNIASSLINIVSDKSYKGYALSGIFTGDYYKAYQYYGCSSLINTDEELLPDTLEIIGDYYRYYEYAGCTSLVSNAEEKILKTVKAIGDNYRAYQYENCHGINKINMRAINWASVGNNYRLNQYSWIATDKKPANIYIEWGIEEGGSWGLTDTRVKNIYVYEWLVVDYQTKLSTITSSKIKKNSDWDNLEYEFIEYIALADSTGKIRIPVGWLSTTMSQDCAYDWMVSIDGEEAEEITGTGGQTYVSVGSDLIEGSEHRVVIKPKTIWWWWGRAFGYLSTGAQAYIKELIHDSYRCYATSRIDTWAHYKHATYAGCTNLINSYEKLPTSVTTIGDYYMKECYAGCTGLKTAFWEVMHKWVSMGVDYRKTEYAGCTALEVHQWIAGWSVSSIPNGYRDGYLGGAGNNMDVYITKSLGLLTVSTDFPSSNKYTVTVAWKYTANWTFNSTSSQWTTYGYFTKEHDWTTTSFAMVSSSDYTSMWIAWNTTAEVGDLIYYWTETPWYGSGNISWAVLKLYEPLELPINNINKVYAYVDDLYDLKTALNISSSKLVAYYYGYICYEMKDINKYTKLLAEVTPPRDIDQTLLRNFDRWFAINRDMTEIAIAGIEYSIDSKSNNYVWAMYYTPSWTVINWEKVLSWLTYKTEQVWGGSNWSGSNISYSWGYAYSQNWILYWHYAYNGSNYDYAWEWNIWQNQTGGRQNAAWAISRNGQFLWWYRQWFKRWKSYTKGLWNSSSTFESVGDVIWNMAFSDDWLTLIMGNSNRSTLTQYTLTSPWDTSTAVSTWKTLSIQWVIWFSYDFKYLFRFNVTTGKLYQYTYED